MVVVLPWHDPLRVAEQVSVLDHMSGGRFILGIGRGLGRVEFDGFRVAMEESRGRFVESAEMLLRGLKDGWCAHDGELVKQPSGHLEHTRGYEYYGRMSEIAREKGGTDALTDFFRNLQVWGTPAQAIEKILDIPTRIGCDTFVGVFSYAGMPWEEPERNVRLFAREVRPALDGELRAGVPTAAEAEARQA